MVLRDKNCGPDEIREKASPEDNDQYGKILPKIESVVSEEFLPGDFSDGLAGVETEGKEGTHEAGKDGDGEAFSEGVVGLACFGLFFRCDLVFLGDTSCPVDGNTDDTDSNAQQDDLT